jgi:hypothetical protein
VLLGAALVLFLFVRSFSFAGCLLGAAMLLTTLRSPRLSTKVRGPGEWKSCSKASLPAARKVPLLVRLFDAHFLLGFAVCMGGLGGIVTLALWRLPMDPYIAAAILSGAVALLPLFTTGGAHLAPPDTVQQPRRTFAKLARKLRRADAIGTKVLARYPLGQSDPDELRLILEVDGLPHGVKSLEVASEYEPSLAGFLQRPCLVLRVLDDSPAYHRLGQKVIWSRGRDRDERVSVLRPALPTTGLLLNTVRQLVAALRHHVEPDPNRSAMSSSSGRLTRNGGSKVLEAA